jgi:hypothetical protein
MTLDTLGVLADYDLQVLLVLDWMRMSAQLITFLLTTMRLEMIHVDGSFGGYPVS